MKDKSYSVIIKLYNSANTEGNYTQALNITVPAVFNTTLAPNVTVEIGVAKTWTLPVPEPSPYKMRDSSSIEAEIPTTLA